MKIIYVNCGVKNCLKEGHCSCRCNLCMQLRKESLKKIQAVNVDHAQELVDWNGERKYRATYCAARFDQGN